jgi:pimeloyl-ACP methyl ester carboxylesterase
VLQKKITLPNGETYGYREQEGDGPTLLLIHGNMTSSKHWDRLMRVLPETYRVVAVDMRGFGESTYYERIDDLSDFAGDIKALVDLLDLAPFFVAGWSTGGGVAMHYAIDHPEDVKGVILVESVGIQGYPILRKDVRGRPIPGDFLTTREEIAADPVQVKPILDAYEKGDKETLRAIWNMTIYTEAQPTEDEYEAYLEDMLTQRNLVDVDYALTRFNLTRDFNGVTAGSGKIDDLRGPVLILQGEKDLVVPPAMGRQIKETLGDRAELIMLEGGHSPLVDNLDRLRSEIIAFIDRRS